MIVCKYFYFFRTSKQEQMAAADGEETSQDSEMSPNRSDRRTSRQFDQDEADVGNILGNNMLH